MLKVRPRHPQAEQSANRRFSPSSPCARKVLLKPSQKVLPLLHYAPGGGLEFLLKIQAIRLLTP